MITLRFQPIRLDDAVNDEFIRRYPAAAETLKMTINFYQRVGFAAPWIGYFAFAGNELAGSCGFKGPPKNNTVEIAYGTLPGWGKKGVATQMCRWLTETAALENRHVRITARTLPENTASAAVLKKNNYTLLGSVMDEDDGLVWEWEFVRGSA